VAWRVWQVAAEWNWMCMANHVHDESSYGLASSMKSSLRAVWSSTAGPLTYTCMKTRNVRNEHNQHKGVVPRSRSSFHLSP
jgi:hypothetical protein